MFVSRLSENVTLECRDLPCPASDEKKIPSRGDRLQKLCPFLAVCGTSHLLNLSEPVSYLKKKRE